MIGPKKEIFSFETIYYILTTLPILSFSFIGSFFYYTFSGCSCLAVES